MKRLFLSYRVNDSGYTTNTISEQLALHFGRTNVFQDNDSLHRRIDSRRDWVRIGLSMAFDRAIPVAPVLLAQTPLPAGNGGTVYANQGITVGSTRGAAR